MLRSISEIMGYHMAAVDGQIGKAHDFLSFLICSRLTCVRFFHRDLPSLVPIDLTASHRP